MLLIEHQRVALERSFENLERLVVVLFADAEVKSNAINNCHQYLARCCNNSTTITPDYHQVVRSCKILTKSCKFAQNFAKFSKDLAKFLQDVPKSPG